MVRALAVFVVLVGALLVMTRLEGSPDAPYAATASSFDIPFESGEAALRHASGPIVTAPPVVRPWVESHPDTRSAPLRARVLPQSDIAPDAAAPVVPGVQASAPDAAATGVLGTFQSRMTVVNGEHRCELDNRAADNSEELQECIDAIPPFGLLEIERGDYLLRRHVVVDKPMTIRTAYEGFAIRCTTTPEGCANFIASPGFVDDYGLLVVRDTQEVTLEHLVFDGNRAVRLSTPAAEACRRGRTARGFNASVVNCSNCVLRDVLSYNALCGTGLLWAGGHATIERNRFEENGDATPGMWADGLTAVYAPDSHIRENQFYENSDVGVIIGHGVRSRIEDNHIRQRATDAFAGLMLDNFNSDDLRIRGDFRDAEVTDNVIDCRPYRCAFGIQVGPRPWYATRNILGGRIWNNEVYGAKVGINVDGAGLPHAPVAIFSNRITDIADGLHFATCGLPIVAQWMNVAPTSVVDRADETTATGSQLTEICQLWSPLARAE